MRTDIEKGEVVLWSRLTNLCLDPESLELSVLIVVRKSKFLNHKLIFYQVSQKPKVEVILPFDKFHYSGY